MSLLQFLGAPSLIALFLGWLGKRYLEKKLEQEKTAHLSEIKRLESKLGEYSEIHKQKVKNSEFFFLRQFDASQALYKLKLEMTPSFRHPDMEWDEAIEEMAENLSDTHRKLQALLIEYFTVLPPELLEKLESAASNAEEGSLYGGNGWGSPGNQCASSVYEKIEECTALMKAEVDGQRLVKLHEPGNKSHNKAKQAGTR